MASRILFNSGLEIDQAISGAYPNIITRGSGFVRDTGVQSISGVKYFYDRITFFSGIAVTGDLVIEGNVLGNLPPKTDDLYDLGSSSLEWRNLFIDGTARIDSLHVDENASITGSLIVYNGLTVSGNSNFSGASVIKGTLGVFSHAAVTGNLTVIGDFIPANFAANLLPKTNNLYDLGSSSQEIRNLYADGTGQIDSLLVDENAVIASGLAVGNGLTVTGASTSTSYNQASSYQTSGSGHFGTLFVTGTDVPASMTSAGTLGQIVWGSGYLYVCTGVGTNKWGRTHLTGWI